MENKEINEKEIESCDEKECFVIMPIGDKEGYIKGHFKRVYEDIFKPAIEKAGFKPYRADDSNASHLIQIDIIKRIIEAPMAICDLSTRNPNVLFELGIRQAFDKPVVLVQECDTERIFDINSINTYEYRKERVYNEVLEDQEKIFNMIKDTFEKHNKGECVNSLLRLINMDPAKNINGNIGSDEMIKLVFNEVMGIKKQLNRRTNPNVLFIDNLTNDDYDVEMTIRKKIDKFYEKFGEIKNLSEDGSIDEYLNELVILMDEVIRLSRLYDFNKLPKIYSRRISNIKSMINNELKVINQIDHSIR